MALKTWKQLPEMKTNTDRILRELGHSEDEIAYLLGHCNLSIHRLREPYKTDVLESISQVYNSTRRDTLGALGHDEKSADERAVELAEK